jgi:hypothetical protein
LAKTRSRMLNPRNARSALPIRLRSSTPKAILRRALVEQAHAPTAPQAARSSRERRLRSDRIAKGETVDCDYAARRT